MPPDKTTIGNNEETKTPSKAFHEYIKTLVEEIVINNAVFNDHKKYLKRYSQEEGVDYATLEKYLTEFFETFEELKLHESKASERLAKRLANECHLDEGSVNQWIVAVNKTRKKAEDGVKQRKERQIAKNEPEQDFGKKQGISWEHTEMGYLANRMAAPSPLTIRNGKVGRQDISIQGHVVIPSSFAGQKVIAIGEGAFSDCTRLVSVVIPNTVDSIGQYAFSNCTRLESVSIPNSVVEFARNAFSGCDSLQEITIGHDNYRKIKNQLPPTVSVHFID